MDKDVILKKAQGQKDEREMEIELRASRIIGATTTALLAVTALLLMILGAASQQEPLFTWEEVVNWILCISSVGWAAEGFYKFKMLGSKRKLIGGIFYTCVSLLFGISFVLNYLG